MVPIVITKFKTIFSLKTLIDQFVLFPKVAISAFKRP